MSKRKLVKFLQYCLEVAKGTEETNVPEGTHICLLASISITFFFYFFVFCYYTWLYAEIISLKIDIFIFVTSMRYFLFVLSLLPEFCCLCQCYIITLYTRFENIAAIIFPLSMSVSLFRGQLYRLYAGNFWSNGRTAKLRVNIHDVAGCISICNRRCRSDGTLSPLCGHILSKPFHFSIVWRRRSTPGLLSVWLVIPKF